MAWKSRVVDFLDCQCCNYFVSHRLSFIYASLHSIPSSIKSVNEFLFAIVISSVSDMAMMSAMLRTSPLSVTLGLSLTIPLAVFGDLIRGTKIGGWTLFAGGSLILGGFIAVGFADASEGKANEQGLVDGTVQATSLPYHQPIAGNQHLDIDRISGEETRNGRACSERRGSD